MSLVAICAHFGAPFLYLIPLAVLAGSVNGAAYGYLRTILNQLVQASRLPRAVGIGATLNEATFVLAPVAASALGSISPILPVFGLAIVGLAPALLIPHVGAAQPVEEPVHASRSILSAPILLWLTCAAAGGATVAAIEIGAVALALSFDYDPTLAILFTVPLCLASVAGGVWVSIRNRMASRRLVFLQLLVMTLGSTLAALEISIVTTVFGAVIMGLVLAPLGTYYALVLDTLAPPARRPEVFALLRTASALGIIFASAVLTVFSLSISLLAVTCLMAAVALVVGITLVQKSS